MSLFTDSFPGPPINPAWKLVNGTWSESPGVLQQTSLAFADPKKAVLIDQVYSSDVQITAKVRVDSWGPGDAARAGVGLCTDPTTGHGYNLLFHNDTNTLQFLDDGVAWGNAIAFAWTVETWYWLKLASIDGVLYGKVWPDGTAEPPSWMIQQSWSGRVGGPSLNGGSELAGNPGSSAVSFAAVTVDISSPLSPHPPNPIAGLPFPLLRADPNDLISYMVFSEYQNLSAFGGIQNAQWVFWPNPTSRTLKIVSAYVWLGLDQGSLPADADVRLFRGLPDGTLYDQLAVYQEDHYAERNNRNGVEYKFAPYYYLLNPDEGLWLRKYGYCPGHPERHIQFDAWIRCTSEPAPA